MKQHAPATQRNREAILSVLERALPRAGTVLEIASGTGEHAVYFARRLPDLAWQPSDVDPVALASISAYREEAGLPNLRPPVFLDATASDWPVDRPDAIVCINMIHIAPWTACQGLLRGASLRLPPGAPLVFYGPYRINGVFTAPSNESFDASLRDRNPAWGVRDLSRVIELAAGVGFEHRETIPMPANNHTIVFERLPRA